MATDFFPVFQSLRASRPVHPLLPACVLNPNRRVRPSGKATAPARFESALRDGDSPRARPNPELFVIVHAPILAHRARWLPDPGWRSSRRSVLEWEFALQVQVPP